MSQEPQSPPPRPAPPPPPASAGDDTTFAAGGVLFAAIMLTIAGVLAIVQGIVAIANNNVYVSTPNYVFQFDLTSWGWIHLILGIIAIFVAWGLMSGAEWARVSAIVLAGLDIIANFMFIPYHPIWTIILIAIDIFIIWSLATYRPSAADREALR